MDEFASLCTPFTVALPVTGAAIAVFGAAGGQSTVCASDATAAKIDEMQFELGEGPNWDALRQGIPVLTPDFGSSAVASWPVFAAGMSGIAVASLFAFPMFLGVATVGVVGLYSAHRLELLDHDIATAVRLTTAATRPAVHRAMRSAEHEASTEVPTARAMRREVHQATGMIVVQLDTDATDAFMRLRAYAFGSGRSVESVAHDVVNRTLDFADPPAR